MKKAELIEIMLYNTALEHSAIVQYLHHVFLIRDEEITAEIEKIARQEMRHMKWFAQKAVQLGGIAKLNRIEEEINIGGPTMDDMLKKNVRAEEKAVEIYTKQLDSVKDDSVLKLLERVIKDEEQHKHEFSELLDKISQGKEIREEREKPNKEIVNLVNKLLKEEYRILLSYLHSFFHSKDWEYKDIAMDLAIESMVHMGELGEKLRDMGEIPDLSMPQLEEGVSVEDYILEEEGAQKDYLKSIEKVKDPELIKLLEWINSHEQYHRHRLVEFLNRMKRFSVGKP